MSASDANRDGQVTRAGMEDFASNGPERQVGMVAYFDQYDADADGVVARAEVEDYVAEHVYRQMNLLDF
jgi:hypothetical protein